VTKQFLALSDFCTIIQGGRHGLSGNDFVSEGYPAYGAGGLNGFLDTYEFEHPAVILSSIGARCGKCFYASGRWSSLANTQVIVPDENKADPRFLWFQLNDEGRWHRSGTGQPFIKPSDVKAHRVFLPPIEDQRRIAAILDEADALRAKRRDALALLDELQRGIFIEMFGDPVTNPQRWPVASLGAVADFYAGNSLPEGVPFVGQEDGYLLMKVSDMNLVGNERLVEKCQLWSGVSGARSATCPQKSIVIPKRGGAIGTNKKRMTVRPTVLDPNLMAVSAKSSLLPDYLFQWFMGFDLSRIVSGSSVPQLNKQDLAPLEIQVPPVELQKIFSERCRQLEVLRGDAETALDWTERLFASVQHRAFRGEL
jgi:type I restriction enzyme S subunit